MSVCAQAKAARRKARQDPRYAKQRNKDATVRRKKMLASVERMKKAGIYK